MRPDQLSALWELGSISGQLDPLERALEGELYRRSLLEFTKAAWPILEPKRRFIQGWPVEAICDHLEAVTRGDIKKLLITVPPGTMKSLLTRVFWPCWEWTSEPSLRYIGASYANTLSERDNRRARTVVSSDWYRDRFDAELAPDQQTKVNFATKQTGWMKATSVGGVATGERGDRFVTDDPHNVLQAESDTVRREAVRWFNEAVPSRVNDLQESAFVVVMQRVHQEDVAAAAIEQGYEHLMVPMHYDPERSKVTSIGWRDPRKRDGELMWPERFSKESVDRLMTQLGPYAAAAQYEQSPVPRSGGQFEVDKINLLDEAPDDLELFIRAWDLAGTEGGSGAFTAGVKAAWSPRLKGVVFLDVRRDRLKPTGVVELVKSTGFSDKDAGELDCVVIPKDPGQAGKAQAQSLAAELTGLVVRIEAQTGSKEVRAEPFSAAVGAGNVYVLNRAWTKAFLDELRFFPMSKHKDQVDSGASAFNELSRRRRSGDSTDLRAGGGSRSNWAEVN